MPFCATVLAPFPLHAKLANRKLTDMVAVLLVCLRPNCPWVVCNLDWSSVHVCHVLLCVYALHMIKYCVSQARADVNVR